MTLLSHMQRQFTTNRQRAHGRCSGCVTAKPEVTRPALCKVRIGDKPGTTPLLAPRPILENLSLSFLGLYTISMAKPRRNDGRIEGPCLSQFPPVFWAPIKYPDGAPCQN